MLKKKFQKKFGLKSLSICLLIAGIIILVIQGLQISSRKEIVREINQKQVMIIKEIAFNLEALIEDLQKKIIIWAKLHPIEEMNVPQIIHELEIFYQLMQDKISHIGIINLNGHFEYFYPPNPQWKTEQKKDFSKTDFFQNALKQTKKVSRRIPYISQQYKQEFGRKVIPVSWALSMNQVEKEGKVFQIKDILGVLVVFLDLSVIDDICQNHYYPLHDYSTFWLIDEKGNFLSHEDKSWIGKNIFHLYNMKVQEGRISKLDGIIRKKIMKGKTGTDIYRHNSKKYYLNYTPVQFLGREWSIAVSTPETNMDYWERRVLKSAWQWWLSVISFVLVCLSFGQVVIILIHKKRINWEKQQKEKFQRAFDGITDLVYMIDIDYNLLIANRAFRDLCAKSGEEFEGEKCFQFTHGRGSPCPDCPIPKTKSSHKTEQLEQLIFQETAHLYAYPLTNTEGETTAIVIFARIITKEKMLEQKLQHRERLSLLGEVAASVVHEIKNPLVGIGILAQLVYDPRSDETSTAENLDRILRECKRLEQLIDNLSRFSRPAPVCFDKGDIHKPLDFSLALLREKLKKNNIHLQTDYQRNIPLITHDSQKMQQVFLNLLINAIKAMPKGGRLNIRTYLHQSFYNDNGPQPINNMVYIDIQDTGAGIPKEVQKGIFRPFFSTSSKGTGLGLSIVHSIIQHHGGQIHLKSQPQQGTLFTICLPLEQS